MITNNKVYLKNNKNSEKDFGKKPEDQHINPKNGKKPLDKQQHGRDPMRKIPEGNKNRPQ